jgi:hypothetical protein
MQAQDLLKTKQQCSARVQSYQVAALFKAAVAATALTSGSGAAYLAGAAAL